VEKLAKWLKPLGIEVSQEELLKELQTNSDQVISHASDLVGGIFSVTSSILGGLFRWSGIGLFTFYLVAEAPKVRRTVCGVLSPERQQRVLFIWNEAIDQTGGYFYSRLLLAIINGTGMFLVLSLFDVPFAAPLGVFVGVVSAFIPIIGTYIGGAVPVLFGLLTSPEAGIAALAYVIIYQQVENLWLSPRLTAKTMSLHPAVAFAAALIGGALGGILFAFLALPAAGVLQAAFRAYGRRYAVVQDELTEDMQPQVGPGLVARVRKQIKELRDDKEGQAATVVEETTVVEEQPKDGAAEEPGRPAG
jgi:predicted PurR-regulated permease PerM